MQHVYHPLHLRAEVFIPFISVKRVEPSYIISCHPQQSSCIETTTFYQLIYCHCAYMQVKLMNSIQLYIMIDFTTIKDKESYTVTKLTGEVVQMKGERLKAYILAHKHIAEIQFSNEKPKDEVRKTEAKHKKEAQ